MQMVKRRAGGDEVKTGRVDNALKRFGSEWDNRNYVEWEVESR